MIARLKGNIIKRNPPSLIIDVNNVGYEVFIPVSSFRELKDKNEVILDILQVKKEDADLLYGFLSESDKEFFKTLIKIKGIGDKTVLQMLTQTTINEFRKHLIEEDLKELKKLPGLGPKTAQRLLLELKGKLVVENEKPDCWNEAISGLTGLGFDKSSAEKTLNEIYSEGDSVSDLIKKALESKK